ncbi:MAG: M1 family metallopeptidase [Gemmatimonadota bacterium]
MVGLASRGSRGLFVTLMAAGWLAGVAGPASGQGKAAADGEDAPGWRVSPFRPLDLPAPNRIRTGGGRPGPDYWQQHVAYEISASIDTATHELKGRGRVTYTNRSPDSLPFLWMKLDGNLCAEESIGSRLDQPPLQFGDTSFDFSCVGGSGVTLEAVESGGRPLGHDVRGTTMRVDLPAPLGPGEAVELTLAWRWTLPESGSGRMGRDGSLYEVAQWYPRMAVYDDLSGWNVDPFIGAGEFYQEYGDYDVELTVPAGFLVAATGVLGNPGDVLTAAQRERLARARGSASAVPIVTEEEARRAGRRAATGTKSWRFAARSVRDFAFAMAPNFRWDASDWDGILIQTFYRPGAKPWEEANRMARETIRYFSGRLGRYPYPHATTVEGRIEGMEYPMLTFVPSYDSRPDLYFVLTHEFGHEWYPMLVGSNERRHPWMDEGFNTFIDIGSVQHYFPGEAYGDTFPQTPLHYYDVHAIPGREQPMALRPVEQHDLYWAAYFKPALMLHLLRTEVLGVERFDRAFREYTAAWSFKHPAPADFFRFMEDAGGMDLDWFWREWIYDTARLDQAVAGVERDDDGRWAVRLESRGTMIMPVELRLTWADGDRQTVRLPVQMWNLGPRFVFRTLDDRRLVRVELDPRGVYPDSDRANDVWSE